MFNFDTKSTLKRKWNNQNGMDRTAADLFDAMQLYRGLLRVYIKVFPCFQINSSKPGLKGNIDAARTEEYQA